MTAAPTTIRIIHMSLFVLVYTAFLDLAMGHFRPDCRIYCPNIRFFGNLVGNEHCDEGTPD
jgi:hypothetical protein